MQLYEILAYGDKQPQKGMDRVTWPVF